MKKIIFIISILLLFVMYLISNPFFISNSKIMEIDTEASNIKIDSIITVSFSAVGDIMCHSTQYNYAWVEKDSFDFNPIFSVLGDYLRNKDILIGNLETVLAGETNKYYGYPYFNTPNSLANALKNSGFDFLTTANNHANDQGYLGAKRTVEELFKVNIIPIGSKIDSIRNYNVFVRKGLKFGLLAYTYGTNYNRNDLVPQNYINYIDTIKIKNDIASLKNKNTDIVLVSFHYGTEYHHHYSKYQKQIVEKTVNYGADIILGAHPHVIQPFERFKTNNANLDSGFVAYSLGNFISNQRWRYSDGGIILNFDISKNIYTDSVYISNLDYLPTWVFKGNTKKGKDYIILPSQSYKAPYKYDFLTEADIDSMKKSFYDNVDLFTKKSNYPKIDTLN